MSLLLQYPPPPAWINNDYCGPIVKCNLYFNLSIRMHFFPARPENVVTSTQCHLQLLINTWQSSSQNSSTCHKQRHWATDIPFREIDLPPEHKASADPRCFHLSDSPQTRWRVDPLGQLPSSALTRSNPWPGPIPDQLNYALDLDSSIVKELHIYAVQRNICDYMVGHKKHTQMHIYLVDGDFLSFDFWLTGFWHQFHLLYLFSPSS